MDRIPYCNHCYTEWMQTHFLDEHVIVRLSDNDYDFPERDYTRQQETLPA